MTRPVNISDELDRARRRNNGATWLVILLVAVALVLAAIGTSIHS